MDAIIMPTDGTAITKLYDAGIRVIDFNVSSMAKGVNRDTISGRPGSIFKGADYRTRTIRVPIKITAYDSLDFPFKRDAVFALLTGNKPFYIIEGRQPERSPARGNPNDYIYGKRYLVLCTNTFEFDQKFVYGKTTIELETVELPFGELTATTLTPFVVGTSGDEVQDNIWTVDAEVFRDDLQYEFSLTAGTNTIRVFNGGHNGGHETVEPEYMDLYIEYRGRSDRLTMVNQTNGSRWERTSGTSPADTTTIRIEGIESTQSNVDIVHLTTGELLSFAPGWNTLRITGVTGPATLKIDMRWYFR